MIRIITYGKSIRGAMIASKAGQSILPLSNQFFSVKIGIMFMTCPSAMIAKVYMTNCKFTMSGVVGRAMAVQRSRGSMGSPIFSVREQRRMMARVQIGFC
jgi:hypothetical protein